MNGEEAYRFLVNRTMYYTTLVIVIKVHPRSMSTLLSLTLKTPITTAADVKLFVTSFSIFERNKE